MENQPISDETLELPKLDPTHNMKWVGLRSVTYESIYVCEKCHACNCHYGNELAILCTEELISYKEKNGPENPSDA